MRYDTLMNDYVHIERLKNFFSAAQSSSLKLVISKTYNNFVTSKEMIFLILDSLIPEAELKGRRPEKKNKKRKNEKEYFLIFQAGS